MDTLNHYRTLIRRLLNEYAELYSSAPASGVETSIICDDEHGAYLLMRIGWKGETRVRRAILYLRLRNNKFWIEEDWTEDGIVTELVRAGVPNGDIVLAFNPPEVRHLTEYAAA